MAGGGNDRDERPAASVPEWVPPSNPMATAGLVCAVAGLLFLGVLFGTAAIVLGLLGVIRAREGAKGYRIAAAAVALGFVAVAVFFVGVAVNTH
jgi:hypothetical protein